MTHLLRRLIQTSLPLCAVLWLSACGGEPVGGLDSTTNETAPIEDSSDQNNDETSTPTDSPDEINPQPNPDATDSETEVEQPTAAGDATQGKTTYTAQCAMCHGESGNGAFPLFVNAVDFESIADITHRTMPFGKATQCEDDCANDVAAYLVTMLSVSLPVQPPEETDNSNDEDNSPEPDTGDTGDTGTEDDDSTTPPENGNTNQNNGDASTPTDNTDETDSQPNPNDNDEDNDVIEPTAPGNAIEGEEIYAAQCATCHGDNGNGNFPLFENAIDYESIADITHRTMPFGNATQCEDDCANDVAAYLVTLINISLPEQPSEETGENTGESTDENTDGNDTSEPDSGDTETGNDNTDTSPESENENQNETETGNETEQETEPEDNTTQPEPTQPPELAPECSSPAWKSGTSYAASQIVVNREFAFRCKIAGWCSSTSDWAYEPQSGLYWEEAWAKIASCTQETSNGNDQTENEETDSNDTTAPDENTDTPAVEDGNEETDTETEDGNTPVTDVAPKAVSTVIAVASNNQDRIGLSWTDNSSNETGFAVRRRTNGSAVIQLVNMAANATAYTDTTVEVGNSYQYDVIAFNDTGSSSAVESNSVTLATPITLPARITNLSATANETVIELTWTAPQNADSIKVYRSPNDTQWTLLTTLAGTASQYTDESAVTEITYGYRISATNEAGESEVSPTAHATLSSPAVEENLFAQHCAACHSERGIGGDIFSDQTKNAWQTNSLLDLKSKVASMPAQQCDGDCKDAVSEYIWLQWGRTINTEEPTEHSAGVRGIRLLTPYEYANSVKTVLNVTVDQAQLPSARFDGHFKYPSQSSLGLVLSDEATAYQALAETIAQQASLTEPSCNTTTCVETAINQLGLMLFRQPLTSQQTQRYVDLYHNEDFESVATSMLMSPYFLYITELGQWDTSTESYRLNDYEVATLLSFSLWGTAPNAALLEKAANGQFNTDANVKAEASLMANDARFATHMAEFIRYYSNSYALVDEKPNLSSNVISAMEQEQKLAVEYLMQQGSGSFDELFNPNYSFLNNVLANHYGLTVAGSSLQKTAVSQTRGGLLHQGIFQVVNSDFSATSLVKRGKVIRENFLCHMLGTPSGVDPDTIELPAHPITTRERWDIITGPEASGGQCWQCHQLMNEPGSALENYDHAGRYRDQETAFNDDSVALTIDASGILRDNTGFDTWANYANARELSEHLSSSEQALSCFVDNAYRFVSGEKADGTSAATLSSLQQNFTIDGDIKTLFIDLVTSPAALYRLDRD